MIMVIGLLGFTTGGCTMGKYSPEKFFDGPELEIARSIHDGNVSAIGKLAGSANLNKVGREGMTLLFYAISEEQYDAVRELVEAGANPYSEIAGFGSPMSVAVEQESPRMLEALLAGGANPNGNFTADTPLLFKAVMQQDVAFTKAFIKAKVNADLKDSLKETAIFTATRVGSFDSALALIEYGASTDLTETNGVSYAWTVHKAVDRFPADSDQGKKIRKIKAILEQRGVKFPPDPPQVVRQKLGIPE
jgi:uncharacterized protein